MPTPAGWTAPEIAALRSGHLSWSGLVRIATPSPARFWCGVGDLAVVNSAFDADGTVYPGGRHLVSFPQFQSLWNGLAERVVVTLDGVTDEMRTLAYDEAADVRGAIVRLAIILFDGDYQQVGKIRWLRRGRCDVIETSNRPGSLGGRVKSISLSLGSQMTGRVVPGQGMWTLMDQQSRPGSSTDLFFERTITESQERTIKWPK